MVTIIRSNLLVTALFILRHVSSANGNTNNAGPVQPQKQKVEIQSSTDESCLEQDVFSFLDPLYQKYPNQPVFLQSVQEMAISLQSLFTDNDKGDFYKKAFLFMTEPERTIGFRVSWMDDKGNLRWNRGWRVEFNSALGPYKGGLRFHPTVDEGILKFLGFEQIFKNALLGLPLGGGKGGSDFDPKGKSEGEIRRFCESFMQELFRYLHPSTDVPAGDIGVGGREIGYMYGTYKKLTNKHGEGVLTGKSILFGGSPLRPEATGYGLVYIANIAIERNGKSLIGANCAVSGSGNVAQYAAKKLMEFDARVVTMSDSGGVLVFKDGMTTEDWKVIVKAKQVDRSRLSEIAEEITGVYVSNSSPWTHADVPIEYAFPCATQNEITEEGAKMLISKHVSGVFEGANLPTTLAGQNIIREHPSVLYIPGKASNAGGVGVSGFEMSQNAQRLTWKAEEVDKKLKDLMAYIYEQMEDSKDDVSGTLEQGANRAGFLKVAQAMEQLGWVF